MGPHDGHHHKHGLVERVSYMLHQEPAAGVVGGAMVAPRDLDDDSDLSFNDQPYSKALSYLPKPIENALAWYLAWAIPGLGMFSEAYIVFAVGLVGPFQQTIWPSCYKTYKDCDSDMVKHLAGYIQICGIIAGMLVWGVLGDYTGRKWGSRCVATIMLSGAIMLTFTSYAPTAYGYFVYFMVSQTWYGFGVGGEYPMAASSAAERSATTEGMHHRRGEQVVLVFSNQGMGNLVNAIVITISMAIFGQTGAKLTVEGSKHVMSLTYGFGAFMALVMVLWRWIFLEESKMYKKAAELQNSVSKRADGSIRQHNSFTRHWACVKFYWHRQLAASGTWLINDFAFYGNKLQQNFFISLLYPTASPYKKLQWTILNSFIALLGYYCAAALIDKPWYGRKRMQYVGFMAMFIFFIIIYAQWGNMGVKGAPAAGVHAFQALYYLSSFFNQFGPNCTTWLLAGEIFPTDIRTSYHGFAAAIGKVGAIIAALWISYISDSRKVFLISALWGLFGWFVTVILVPDTTGLELKEYDVMQKHMLEGNFEEYEGEGINPKHLSLWEIYVLKWGKNYRAKPLDSEGKPIDGTQLQPLSDGKHA